MAQSPIEQFKIENISGDIIVGGLNISFTNAALFMVLTTIAILIFLYIALKRTSVVPSRIQMTSEMSYNFVGNMARENIGDRYKVFFPFVYSLFMFILFGNLIGVIPYSFAFTSHIAVTFTLAIAVFFITTVYGIYVHGFKFLRIFAPSGIPIVLIPLMFVIELLSYFAKAMSMGVRLFANIMAGHIIMEIFAGFIIALGIFGFIPFAMTLILFGFELVIACLQAYIFTILTCLFLQQVTEFH